MLAIGISAVGGFVYGTILKKRESHKIAKRKKDDAIFINENNKINDKNFTDSQSVNLSGDPFFTGIVKVWFV